MPPSYVVFDFDGTVTQVEKISASFVKDYRSAFAAALGADPKDLGWDEVAEFVRAESPRLGWKFGGWEVAPAGADPYIFAGTVAELVLERRGVLDGLRGLSNLLYAEMYKRHEAKFRKDTKDVVDACLDAGAKVCFISNASTDKLRGRLEHELGRKRYGRISVVGDAGKFLVRDFARGTFEKVPLAVAVPELARPVLLRRGRYANALAGLWGDDRDGAASTLVCGDIYELDLALPAHLGCSVHLVERDEPFATCAYERAAVASLGARGSVGRLGDLLARLA